MFQTQNGETINSTWKVVVSSWHQWQDWTEDGTLRYAADHLGGRRPSRPSAHELMPAGQVRPKPTMGNVVDAESVRSFFFTDEWYGRRWCPRGTRTAKSPQSIRHENVWQHSHGPQFQSNDPAEILTVATEEGRPPTTASCSWRATRCRELWQYRQVRYRPVLSTNDIKSRLSAWCTPPWKQKGIISGLWSADSWAVCDKRRMMSATCFNTDVGIGSAAECSGSCWMASIVTRQCCEEPKGCVGSSTTERRRCRYRYFLEPRRVATLSAKKLVESFDADCRAGGYATQQYVHDAPYTVEGQTRSLQSYNANN